SDQIDDVMSMFGDNDIAIVDEANKVKLPETKPPEPEPVVVKEEDQATPQEKAEQEEEDAYSKSNDPVRMYLRKMGSVSLLTREGEVEIAKRIEDGERRVLQVVLNCQVAIDEILDLGDKLRKLKIRVKEVVKDADEDDAEFDEQFHIERVCKALDKVRRLHKEVLKVHEKIDVKGASEASRKKGKQQITELKNEMFDALQELRLNK